MIIALASQFHIYLPWGQHLHDTSQLWENWSHQFCAAEQLSVGAAEQLIAGAGLKKLKKLKSESALESGSYVHRLLLQSEGMNNEEGLKAIENGKSAGKIAMSLTFIA